MHYFATSQLFNKEKIQEVVSFFAKGHQFVKVTFETEEEVRRILNNKKQLQKHQQFNKIYIEPKRTKEEQQKFHEERIRRKQQRITHQSPRPMLSSNMYLSPTLTTVPYTNLTAPSPSRYQSISSPNRYQSIPSLPTHFPISSPPLTNTMATFPNNIPITTPDRRYHPFPPLNLMRSVIHQ